MQYHRSAIRGFTLVEIMIVVAIIGVLMAVAVPNFVKSREVSRQKVCIENLTQIESAKQLWGLENNKKNGELPEEGDLIGPSLYIKVMPSCPAGGDYEINEIGAPATCTISGHVI